jgi:hypothetical protein
MFPKCDLPYEPKEFKIPHELSYDEFIVFVCDYVEEDCWGLEFNGKEIFNSYGETEKLISSVKTISSYDYHGYLLKEKNFTKNHLLSLIIF